MKIKKIKFYNINSLKGEWEIDFEKFENLFLISGNTGSGKTTILDAICLALYAKTPRQDNGGALMSKNTGECYSECEFEVNGDIYKSYWGIKRARNKADGKLQNAKMKLSKNDEIISDKVMEVKKKIKEITNFDFNQFTKSMMLAQGGFDKFLKAKDSEKASLLEEITGSEIYGVISTKVYEVYNEKLNEVKQLRDKIDDSDILSDEEIKNLNQEIKILQDEANKLQKELEDKKTLKNNYQNFIKLTDELEKSNNLLNETNEKISQLKPVNTDILKQEEIVKLKFQTLNNNQKEIENLENKRKENQNKLETISIKEIEEEIDKLKEDYEKLDSQNMEELIDKKNELQKILNDTKEYKNLSINQKELLDKLNNLNIEKLEESQTILLDEITKLEEIIESTQKIIDFEEERKNLEDGEPCPLCGAKEHPYTKSLPEYKKTYKQELKQKKQEYQKISKELFELHKQKNKYKEKLQNIDEKLKKLTPTNDEEDIKNNINEIEAKIEEMKKKDGIYKQLSNKEKELLIAENRIKELNNEIDNQTKDIQRLNKENKEINQFFESLKIDNIDKFLEEIEKIKSKQNDLKKLEDKKLKIEAQIEHIKNECNKIKEKKDIKQEELDELKSKLDEIKNDYIKKEHLIELSDKKYKQLQDSLKVIEDKEKELKYYELLNNLIGQKDGGKYRTFVQNLTLKYLINLANEHLKTLTDRYILTKTSKDNLSLEIVDLYQANTIREISTLSGGESFLVSLALSLGLTDLVSNKIKIDTLFIDEGFGSLDENSLNIVIDSLERLQSKGKIIGIISHINILKERISSQIQLIKKSDGFSDIKVN